MPGAHLNRPTFINNVSENFISCVRWVLDALNSQAIFNSGRLVHFTIWWVKHLIVNTRIIWPRSLRHYCMFHSSLLSWLKIEFMSRRKWLYTIWHIRILHIRLIFALRTNSPLKFIQKFFIGDQWRLWLIALLWCLAKHINIVTVYAPFTLVKRLLMFLCIARKWFC